MTGRWPAHVEDIDADDKLVLKPCDPQTCDSLHGGTDGEWPSDRCMNCHRLYSDPRGCEWP